MRGLPGVALGAVGLALAAPAASETVHSWHSEDGSVAFTDDLERVPARYQGQVETRVVRGLGSYARFTPQDGRAAERYAQRLAARLADLRALDAEPATPARAPEAATTTLSLRTGDADSPALQLPAGAGSGPIVIEKVFSRPAGKMVTRQSVVVRRGDQILAVVKPRLREWNVAQDIADEESLER